MKKALYLLLCINSNNDKISISSGNSQVGSTSNLQSRRNSLVAPPSVDGLAKASSSDLNLAANRESPRTSQRRGSLTGRVSHSLYKLVGSFRVNPLVLNRVNPLVLDSMKAYDIKSNPKNPDIQISSLSFVISLKKRKISKIKCLCFLLTIIYDQIIVCPTFS